jgi:hypothetical protein
MNIFNKYKSHFIASIGTLAFLGLLIVILCIKPFGDSNSLNPDDLADQELPIQFQPEMLEDIPLPPPSNTQNTTEEVTKETQAKEMTSPEDVEQGPQNLEVSVKPAKVDSALIAELRKSLDEIKNTTPEDTIKKEQIQQKDIQQVQKNLADNAQNFYADRQFYYDNYRAILNLKKVYPYVQRTKEIVARMNTQLATIKDKREQRKLIKKAEKELFAQFEKDVRNMSTSQGKLLLKLIARETNQSAYGLIKTYKGTIPATFWYGVGLIFHENLKLQYDSIGEDAQLEKIVQKYKRGNL